MNLFEPYDLGGITLKNRFVMAPLTRSRAIGGIPNKLMATYYRQRAGAGLIISEGVSPSPNGLGYVRTPGAFTDEQIKGWKSIAEAVHEEGGKIFIQLMHCGRITGKTNMPLGAKTVAPSAIQAPGEIYTDTEGMVPHDIPSALTIEEIETEQNAYAKAAKRLIEEAGVDGIELHAANGYLLNQFLNPKSNIRGDNYGGLLENRARFVLETAEKVVDAVGGDKVGIRLSPYGAFNDMEAQHDEVVPMFTYLAKELAQMGLAYIHVVDQRIAFGGPEFLTDIQKTIKDNFGGTIITGGDIDSSKKAQAILDQGMDLVYAGRAFISNPDLVEKLKKGTTLVVPNPDTFYTADAVGYTDY